MDKLLIQGKNKLEGEIYASGAKNSALPVLAACLLSDSPMKVSNLPHLIDVTTMIELLGSMGLDIMLNEDMDVFVDAAPIKSLNARYELVKTMRASILVLGPLLTKFSKAEVALPGGCAIGSRPVNLHIDSMRSMGAEVVLEEGYIKAKSKGRLKGTKIDLDPVSVTATENILMAAVLAEGETIISNAAKEPEVVDLIKCLRKMGAQIKGEGTDKLVIEGVKNLSGCEYSVMPDRVETATYLTAVAMTGGSIKIKGTRPDAIQSIVFKLKENNAKNKLKEKMNLSDKQKGIALSLIGVLIITPDSLFIRLIDIPSWELLFYRGLIPFFCLLIALIFYYKKQFIHSLIITGFSGLLYAFLVALGNATFVLSIQNTNVANTLVMIALTPFATAVLSSIFLKEHPNKKMWLTIIACFATILFIFY